MLREEDRRRVLFFVSGKSPIYHLTSHSTRWKTGAESYPDWSECGMVEGNLQFRLPSGRVNTRTDVLHGFLEIPEGKRLCKRCQKKTGFTGEVKEVGLELFIAETGEKAWE